MAVQTKMQNVSGITTAESRKATDLLMKCQYLDEITDGKGVVFCTGTPISNSAAELYTMMRYIQADTLREHGLYAFDAWAANFGETVSAMELAPEGTGYRMKTRFARFNNLPELISMWKLAADVQTADMLKLEVPELEGGKPTVIICVGYDPKIIGFAGYLQGEQRYRIELNPKQNFSSFRAVLENISAQIPVKIAAREEIEKNIESAKEAAKQPFAYEEEFQTKLARLNELNILLDQEKQELVQNEKENRMQKENVNLHAEENEDWEASTVEPAAKLPAGWKWTMYSDGSGRLEGPDKQSLYSYDRMTYASAGEIEYRKSNNSSWDVFPEGSLDRFREWAEQQLLQELKKEPLQYQEFLEHQSHQDDEIEKNPLDMEDAARQAGLTVQRDQDKPGAAYFDADQNVIHVSDAGSEEDVRLSELKGYADAVIQRTATVEQPVRDLESASLAVMLAARYDVGVSDRLSQQLASAHAEAVKCPTFDLPVTLQRLDKALDYCDHFLAHEQERALEQEAENEPEPEQVTELSPQSQAFMMDL